MLNAGVAIVSESGAVADAEAESVTFTVKFAFPAAVGVPEIAPPGERLNPAGSDPPATDHE